MEGVKETVRKKDIYTKTRERNVPEQKRNARKGNIGVEYKNRR